jgi:hypothetical protein
MSDNQAVYDGAKAREVLDNEQFHRAFDLLQEGIIEKWTTAPARDAEGREKLWLMQSLLKQVKTALVTTMESGLVAQKNLEYSRSLAEKAKAFVFMG